MSLLGIVMVFLWAQERGRALPVQVTVDKRSWGPERNSEKEWMCGDRRVVVKVHSCSEQSNPTALISVASWVRVESNYAAWQQWTKQSHGSYQCCFLSGSREYAWGLRTGIFFSCGRVQSACSTGWRAALSLAQLVRPHERFLRVRATSGRISGHKWHRVMKHATPMEHPDGPSHVVGNIAERLTKAVRGHIS